MTRYTVAILLALSVATLSAAAQSRPTAEQLKPFVGYYRSPVAKDLVVHFLIEHDTLIARPLWRDLTFHLVPKTELVFHTLEPVEAAPIDITFYRDSAGGIVAMSLGNEVRWNRESHFQPTTRKEMAHTPDQLTLFQGVYALPQDPYRLIRLYTKENNLILQQIWDDQEVAFVPEAPMDFFSKAVPLFTLHFTKDKDGNITQLLAFGRDTWIRVKQPDLSAAALSVAAGKYQSKDDPDNQITISIGNKELVIKQLWDGQEIALQALTDTYYYNPAKSYKVMLYKEDNGKVNEVVLLGTSVFVRVAP